MIVNKKIVIIAIILVILLSVFFYKLGSSKKQEIPQAAANKPLLVEEKRANQTLKSIEGLTEQKAIHELDKALEGTKNPDARALLIYKKAEILESQAKLSEARDLYKNVLNDFPEARILQDAQNKFSQLSMKLLFSPVQTEDSMMYEVKSGDSLAKIAKNFSTTVELIKKSNILQKDVIRPGQKLKITKGKFSVLVDKSQNILILKKNDEVIKTYIVSTGLNGCTPVGNFTVVNKLVNPTWYKAGVVVPPTSPENILGTRWLGISIEGYGIHGTTEPENIGKAVTAGCVRMLKDDVEELYDVLPVGTEVTVID